MLWLRCARGPRAGPIRGRTAHTARRATRVTRCSPTRRARANLGVGRAQAESAPSGGARPHRASRCATARSSRRSRPRSIDRAVGGPRGRDCRSPVFLHGRQHTRPRRRASTKWSTSAQRPPPPRLPPVGHGRPGGKDGVLAARSSCVARPRRRDGAHGPRSCALLRPGRRGRAASAARWYRRARVDARRHLTLDCFPCCCCARCALSGEFEHADMPRTPTDQWPCRSSDVLF